MNANTLILAFGAVLLASAVGSLVSYFFFTSKGGTIQAYFWGDQKLSLGLVASLLLSNSFSLNGLLYQTWLGFTIGWYSLLVQAVWCASFVILALNAPRFRELLGRGTMHGIIASRFGGAAGRMAAIASVVGFSILIGWEAVVGATVLKETAGATNALYLVLPLALVFIASLYTMTGGLRGNAVVNAGQNLLKIAVLVGATTVLFSLIPSGWESLTISPAARISLPAAIAALGGIALAANLAFSLLWQVVDMSVWQNLSATNPTGRGRAIGLATILVFLFPGLIGSLIGIGLSAVGSPAGTITDANILNQFALAISSVPVMTVLLFCAFAASMLSTIDGYALAAAQASTWDLVFPKTVRRLLALGNDRDPEAGDRTVLTASRLLVIVIALLGAGGVMWLVIGGGVGLFDLVYIVVIAQMSLVGPVLLCLVKPSGRRIVLGGLPIIAGILVGAGLVAQRFLGHPEFFAWAPVGAIGASIVFTLLVWWISFALPPAKT